MTDIILLHKEFDLKQNQTNLISRQVAASFISFRYLYKLEKKVHNITTHVMFCYNSLLIIFNQTSKKKFISGSNIKMAATLAAFKQNLF